MKSELFNPYLPLREYVPDGEPHIFNNRLYIYGSHDRFNGDTYCLEPYVCYSCDIDDLGNFVDHGIIYDGKQDPLNDTKKRLMFAPDVAYKNGKYYLYYGLDSSIAISVAIADKPEGPFKFYGHVKHKDGEIWGMKKGDCQQFDPGVFVDDDGSVYLYSGFSSTPEVIDRIKNKLPEGVKMPFEISCSGNRVATLQDDMLTIKEIKECLIPGVDNSLGTGFEGHEFFEASSMRKFNNKYYLIYSSVNGHELCYAISDYPNKDFEYGGILHSNGNIGIDENAQYYYANNHGSLIKIKDDYYVFGHRHTNGNQYSRQGVVEKITMDKDSHFKQAEMTSLGFNKAYLKGEGEYPASIACVLKSKGGAFKSDSKLDKANHPYICQDEENNFIENIQDGTVVGYKYFNFCKIKEIGIKVLSSGKGMIKVYEDLKQEPVSLIEVNCSKEIKDYFAEFKGIDGVNPLYFRYEGEGSIRLYSFVFNK